MKKNELLIVSFIIVVIICCYVIISNTTFAYQYDTNNYTLFFKDNKLELEKDMKKYLSDFGGMFIVNTDYTYSDVLANNYNFLVYFAFDYILMNRENFVDDIVYMDEFSYYDKNYISEYVSFDVIYSITDKFFGVRDFKIINDDVNIINNYVSLIDYNDVVFMNKLLDIDIEFKNDNILVYASYDYGKYLFTFLNKYNVLKLYNIEVLS